MPAVLSQWRSDCRGGESGSDQPISRLGPSAAALRFGDIYACQALLSLGSLPNLSLARFVRGKAEPSSGNGSEDTGPDQAGTQ